MNKLFRIVGVAVCSAAMLCSGCSISLFSGEHIHYHGGAEIREKVEDMEKRIDTIEKTAAFMGQK